MDRDKTAEKSTPQPPQRTPKTPTNPRVKSSSLGRASPYSIPSASPSSKPVPRSSSSNNSTPTLPLVKDEPDSTTPVYPESSVLLSSTTSNAKIQLSDMQPVDADLLERIKNVEISLKQHRDSEDQILKKIKATKQEYHAVKEHHEQVMQAGKTRLKNMKRAFDRLQEESLKNSGNLQELWEKVRESTIELEEKDNRIIELKREFVESKKIREQILKDRSETEEETITRLQKQIKQREMEYDDILNFVAEAIELEKSLGMSYGEDEIESLKAKILDKDARILQLEATKAQYSAAMIEEKYADDLIQLFKMVYERRIRAQEAEFRARVNKAKEDERTQAMEARQASDDLKILQPLLKEMEAKASREEYDLMIEKDELVEMEKELESLRLELLERTSDPVK
ncbi:hypothetical protein BGZ80_003443 [Entomortierella chlamydospora]|uniref:Uncharacterized protein n=1 Tax=Entomortierella chlamydospora TaxID=101097 RepID=A0A9P6N0N9_9FUNG|nr:hypothetical protein BGZ79_004655 [Entomortierella chlamydospora]KAG0020871.1 hypothetical protein BGZ80_003443 [Entomortierella chlamydospora]